MDLDLIARLSWTGNTLNAEERAALHAGGIKKRAEERCGQLSFWGRIVGSESDYLVLVALSPAPFADDVPQKRFWFCTRDSLASLQELPQLNETEQKMCSTLGGRFKGDPGFVIQEYTPSSSAAAAAAAAGGDSKGDDADGGEQAKLTEAHRLAFAVRQIDAATSIVPVGAYFVDAARRVMRNAAFEGLTVESAKQLGSYLHFVASGRMAKLEAEGRLGAASAEFLASIATDEPRGSWSVQVDSSQTTVTLRSLLFPGYFFFHDIGTAKFGGAYFGDGARNDDLLFML